MSANQARYSIELMSPEGNKVEYYDDPDEAMRVVNRLRATRNAVFIVRDGAGVELNDQQLAMIVMGQRLHGTGVRPSETDDLTGAT